MGPLPDFKGLVVGFGVVCVVVGAALAFVLPWLWNLIRPWIHALTA